MKTLNSILTLLLLICFVYSCKNKTEVITKTVENGKTEVVRVDQKQMKNANDSENFTVAKFTIKGMTCAMGCAKTIEKKLAKMDGIYNAKVDFENELATVEFDAEKIDKDALVSTVSSVSKSYSVENLQLSDQAFSK